MSNELTPETDALVPQFLSGGLIPDIFAHARKLEQERDEARKIIADSLKALPVGYIPTHTPESIPERITDLVATIVGAERERDEAREHLSAAKHFLNKYIAERDEWAVMCGRYKQERDEARAVLQEIEAARLYTACELRRIATRALDVKI